MGRPIAVSGNCRRGLAQLTAFQRAVEGIARSAELNTFHRTVEGIARSAELNTFHRTVEGIARSTELNTFHRTVEGIARSTELNTFHRTVEGIARSTELNTFHRTVEGIARSAELTTLHRTVVSIARSTELTTLHRTVGGIKRAVEVSSLLSYRFSDALAPFREKAQFEETEWFPHSTFPRHLLNGIGHDAYSDEIVLTYYRDNWSAVKRAIEQELSECHVDRDAKEAVRQALIAHENGLYQLVPPALFTAIERSVRVGLYDDRVGNISVKERLVNILGKLPSSVLPDGVLAFVGFNQLSHHLYENIRTDDVRERFLDTSIPNRHATIHGLVIYSSEKSSLNAIFVAMYVFRILTVLKLRNLRST